MADPTSSTKRWSATLVLLGTFVLGMIAGAAILHIVLLALRGPGGPHAGPPFGEPPVVHLRRTLGLSPEQADQLRAIFEESRGRMRAEAEATRNRIRRILTPEQRAKFDAMGPPPPPPPGFPPPPPPDEGLPPPPGDR